MQHDTNLRVPTKTARPDGRRLLQFLLEPLFRVARQFFQTLSLIPIRNSMHFNINKDRAVRASVSALVSIRGAGSRAEGG
jgi:hypothetical protein